MSEQGMKNTGAQQTEGAGTIPVLSWKIGCAQNIGSRSEQQDSIDTVPGVFRDKPVLLAVLADGMGGMKNGAEYSRITVDFHRNHFQRILDASKDLPSALLSLALQANEEAHKIYDESKPGGTTLVAALLTDECFYTLSVGDSRICLYRKNRKLNCLVPLQLNREHVLGQALDESAWMGRISFEDAESSMLRNSLTSAVGPDHIRYIDRTLNATAFLKGDKLALMSDGIYRALSDMEIAADMEEAPEEAAEKIIRHVCGKKIPHQDNMSIVIIEKI